MNALFLLLVLLVLPGCRRAKQPARGLPTITTASGIEMVAIPGGWFEMGSSKGQPDELPRHKVYISPFFMDKFEVIQQEFKKYQISDPSHFKSPTNPLDQINWTDAAVYCNERSLAEGLEPCYDEETWRCNFDANGYRLPTEAEWEYACRAGSTTAYSFGDDPRALKDYGWFKENSAGRTHPVGQKKPNPWGLYDMHGNVAEWCNDFYRESYYRSSPAKNPTGPPSGTERVLRGGAWNSTPQACRSAYRASDPSINDTCLASDTIGFRCVRRVSKKPSSEANMTDDNPRKPISKTAFIYHEIYLEHYTPPGHPERPERLIEIIDALRAEELYPELLQPSPAPAPIEWIRRIHPAEYIERASTACEHGLLYLDTPDVPVSRQSYDAALVAAGGILAAVDAIVQGKARNAFCAVRPPGHHALGNHAMGFCIFNNVAIGTRYVQEKYGLSKVLIVDWDVHHGNGTQAAFYDDPNVLYFSVHQYPFYPGTGAAAETGKGNGLNYNINVPLPAGSGDGDYIKAFKQRLWPAAPEFCPDFIFISAGFDAHEDDLLGRMAVTTTGFARLTEIVLDIARQCCRGRVVSVLEGGYNLAALAESVAAHIRVLAGDEGT